MSVPVLSFRPQADAVVVDLDRLISSRMLAQADSGGGKSRLLRSLCEQLHGRVQIIVLDPEGEFATLRERYPFLLAGRDGDVATDPKTAKLLARRLMELGASAVVDLYDLKLHDRRRYLRLFLEEIMGLPRRLWRPCLFVIDEAHVYVPQGAEAESSDAVITLCTQGRKRGYCAVLATQRISKLHKDAAAELKNRAVGSTGLDLDMKRAGDDLGFDKEQRLGLRLLDPGTFWVYGPAISREPVLVRTGPVHTTHPTPGAVAAPTPPAPEAVRKMLSQMQGLEREAEEEARSIEDLQRQLTAAKAQVRKLERAGGQPVARATPVVDERAIARAVTAAERDLRAQFEQARRDQLAVERQLRSQIGDLTKRVTRVGTLAGQIVHVVTVDVAEVAAAAPPAPTNGSAAPDRAARAERRSAPTPPPRQLTGGDASLPAPLQKILGALVQFEALGIDEPERANVGAIAGYTASGGTFNRYVSDLSSRGLLRYPGPGTVALTEEGRAAAPAVEPIESIEQLHAAWLALKPLGGPHRALLQELIDAWPEALPRTELAERCDYTASGGTFNRYISTLSSLGLITYPDRGTVRASDLLFPEGLR